MARNRKRQTIKKTTVARKAGHILSARVGTLNSPSQPSQTPRQRRRKAGRPVLAYPPRIDATPDELVDAMFRLTPEQAKDIRENAGKREYRCSDCQRTVNYPETLYNDGRCEKCHKKPPVEP